MTKSLISEDIPFHFEKLLAGIGFLELLEKNSMLSMMQVKPDRKNGPPRRIEDFTKFYSDGSIEVFQIKHTQVNDKFGFSDLWTVNPSPIAPRNSGKREGKNIFKFLKSWRIHRSTTNSVSLTILTNRKPRTDFDSFIKDVKKLRKSTLEWRIFSKRYSKQIKSIKFNCSAAPFSSNVEIKSFLCSLNYKRVSDIDDLEKDISEKLEGLGVIDIDKIDAFIQRITKVFISNNVDVFPSTVNKLINRLKTGLIQEIITPPNYIERTELENKLLEAIQSKKKKGGFVLLFAPPGSGKTVLLSKLAENDPDFFPYFCRIRPLEAMKSKTGYLDNARLKSRWFKTDIIQRCYEFGLLPETVGVTDSEFFIEKVFDRTLKILSDKALERKDKKIVIIIDALDQIITDKHKGDSVLDAIPPRNYPGLVFILSTWSPKYLPPLIKDLPQNIKKEVRLDIYFSEKEIKSYFQKANVKLTQDQVVLIKKKTAGLAISIFYLSKKLKQQVAFNKIIQESSCYKEVFDWYKPIWSRLSIKEKECLGYLCFHFAGVTRENLRTLMRKKMGIAEFNGLLNTIQHFLDTSRGLIEPYHDSFRRFIISKLIADKKAYHQKLFTHYSKYTHLPYAKKYITKHMEAVGLTTPLVRATFKKLHNSNFFEKVLKARLGDSTKVEIGKSFVNYFYIVKDIKQLVGYSVAISNIYPTTYADDLFEKIYVGGEKFILEVENELLFPKGDHPRQQREWLFKRLSVGNILAKKEDKNSLALSHRFIDDGLFRISLNRELLWHKDEQNDFWNNAEEYTQALINANQYKSAVEFYRSISFQNPTLRLVGFLSKKLAEVHLYNLKLNKKETLDILSRAPKIERLITYIEMGKKGLKIPFKGDFKKLISNESNEKYFCDDKYDQQVLDFAESLFIYGIVYKNKRILKLLKKVKIKLPYWSRHGYISWGLSDTSREVFLRWLTLKKIADKNFNLKDFYGKLLREKFPKSKSLSEYENEHFLDILLHECNLGVNRLLTKSQKITWKKFWKEFKNILKIYKDKIDKIDKNIDAYLSDEIKKECHPYSYNLRFLLIENLKIIDRYYPHKMFFTLKKIEQIFSMEYLIKREDLLKDIISVTTARTPIIKDKIETYLRKALEIRQSEKTDRMNKSSNLRSLAVLAVDKDFQKMGEDIFKLNLKYSRGLWNEGDLRFTNFVDAVRTQKQDQFKIVLKYIETVSNVVEGGWYWRLDFLESVAYTDYRQALSYQYEFTTKGKANHNDSLRRIIKTFTRCYPYNINQEILPILRLMDIKDENTFKFMENITASYSDVWMWGMVNQDFKQAKQLILEYIACLNRDVEPASRINLLQDLVLFLNEDTQLKEIYKYVQNLLAGLKKEGYKEAPKSNSELNLSYTGLDIKKLKIVAKKGQISTIIKILNKYYNKEKSHFIDGLIAELVPILNYVHIKAVRKWALSKNINIEGPMFFSSLIGKAAKTNNKLFLAKTISELFKYINNSELSYEIPKIIKALDKIKFSNKKMVIKKILITSIRKLAGGGYSLPQLFYYSSEYIDKYFPDIKKFSYAPWKNIVEKSIRLSLSK